MFKSFIGSKISIFILGLCGGAILLFGIIYVVKHPPAFKFGTASTVEAKYGKPNANIAEADNTIFADEFALYSHLAKYGVKKTMDALHGLSATNGDCHNTAHEAGRMAYELTGEEAFQTCSAVCHSGCYHGATEAFFQKNGTANLTENLSLICNEELNSFFSHQCLHGIGHGLMAWTSYELFEALQGCDLLPRGTASCYSGVFMENVVGGLAKEATEEQQENFAGHFTQYLSDDPHYPCNIVEDKYKWGCYIFQTSRMLQILNYDFAKVAKSCMDTPEAFRRTCFESLGRDIGGTHRGNPNAMIQACQSSPLGPMRNGCLVGAVQDSFWDPSGQDTALTLCKTLKRKDEKDECYNTIFWRAPDVLAAKTDQEAFCLKTESAYQDQCQRHIK